MAITDVHEHNLLREEMAQKDGRKVNLLFDLRRPAFPAAGHQADVGAFRLRLTPNPSAFLLSSP